MTNLDAALPAYATAALAALRALAATGSYDTHAARGAAFGLVDCAAMAMTYDVQGLIAEELGLNPSVRSRHLCLDIAQRLVREAELAASGQAEQHMPLITSGKNGGTRKVTMLSCSCGAKLGSGMGGDVVSNLPESRGGRKAAEARYAEHLAAVGATDPRAAA